VTAGTDFDPLQTADALAVLETELEGELQGEGAAQGLFRLRIELLRVAQRGREWALRRGIGPEHLPEWPDGAAPAGDWLAFSRRLAEGLRKVATLAATASEPPSFRSMHEVARWLQNREAEAFLELLELAHALDSLVTHVERLDGVLRDLGFELMALEENDPGRDERIRQCAARAARASSASEGILNAVGQIRNGVRGWSALTD
jgi:hypothetical protein